MQEDESPIKNLMYKLNVNYMIGLVNTPIHLDKYYSVSSGYSLVKAEVKATNGALPSSSYSIDDSTLTFTIHLNDP